MWNNMLKGHSMGHEAMMQDFMRDEREAFERGRAMGHREAMEQMQGGMQHRGYPPMMPNYNERDGGMQGGGYNERMPMYPVAPMMPNYNERGDYGGGGYNERRGVEGTGPYGRGGNYYNR